MERAGGGGLVSGPAPGNGASVTPDRRERDLGALDVGVLSELCASFPPGLMMTRQPAPN